MEGVVQKLYESDSFLVVNKPYDMYINSDDETQKNTVTHHIASGDSHLASSANPLHFVQRLDFATSGVLCIAKKRSAAGGAGKLFQNRETKKYYIAVVRGHVKHEFIDIDYKVGSDPATADTSHKMVALSGRGVRCQEPRDAHTRLLALETGYYDKQPVTFVLLKPITGRRHQLRVHCAAIGHTILGDFTYGADRAPHRMFLHATRLVLPLKEEPLDIMTTEPFIHDELFRSKWKPARLWHKYRTKDDFLAVCDITDKLYVLGINYKLYNYTEKPELDEESTELSQKSTELDQESTELGQRSTEFYQDSSTIDLSCPSYTKPKSIHEMERKKIDFSPQKTSSSQLDMGKTRFKSRKSKQN